MVGRIDGMSNLEEATDRAIRYSFSMIIDDGRIS